MELHNLMTKPWGKTIRRWLRYASSLLVNAADMPDMRCFAKSDMEFLHDANLESFGMIEKIINSLTHLPSTNNSSLPSSLFSSQIPNSLLFCLLIWTNWSMFKFHLSKIFQDVLSLLQIPCRRSYFETDFVLNFIIFSRNCYLSSFHIDKCTQTKHDFFCCSLLLDRRPAFPVAWPIGCKY